MGFYLNTVTYNFFQIFIAKNKDECSELSMYVGSSVLGYRRSAIHVLLGLHNILDTSNINVIRANPLEYIVHNDYNSECC